MSHLTREETNAGFVQPVSSSITRESCSSCAKSKVLLSMANSLKNAAYLIAGLLALLMFYGLTCELDLADQEFNRSHHTYHERS